jgi:hypothetical protein
LRVHAESIGHGKRVPVDMLPPPLVDAVNEKLEALRYEPLSRAWNVEERPLDVGSQTLWVRRLRGLMEGVRIAPGVNGRVGLASFARIAEDHRRLRWGVDVEAGKVTEGDGDVEGALTGTAEDLVLMLTEEENLSVLLRSGRSGT